MKAQGCRPSAFIVSRLSSWEAHQFKDCLHRVQRLEEQLEFSLEVLGTIEKKLSIMFSNVHKRKSHELQCKPKC